MKAKTFTLLCLLLCINLGDIKAQAGSKDPVYLEVISNASKTINYTVGVYPMSCRHNEAGDRTYLTMYVMNQGTQDLVWTKNNHVLVVLKNNTLAYNYNTVAEAGNYTCAYTVAATKGFHEQTLCFDVKFTASDIANIYLLESGDVYRLMYYKGE